MDYVTAADAWAHAHPYVLAALGTGWANRRLLFRLALLGALKTKWGRWLLLGHEDEILADLTEATELIKQVVDEAKKSDTPAT